MQSGALRLRAKQHGIRNVIKRNTGGSRCVKFKVIYRIRTWLFVFLAHKTQSGTYYLIWLVICDLKFLGIGCGQDIINTNKRVFRITSCDRSMKKRRKYREPPQVIVASRRERNCVIDEFSFSRGGYFTAAQGGKDFDIRNSNSYKTRRIHSILI